MIWTSLSSIWRIKLPAKVSHRTPATAYRPPIRPCPHSSRVPANPLGSDDFQMILQDVPWRTAQLSLNPAECTAVGGRRCTPRNTIRRRLYIWKYTSHFLPCSCLTSYIQRIYVSKVLRITQAKSMDKRYSSKIFLRRFREKNGSELW